MARRPARDYGRLGSLRLRYGIYANNDKDFRECLNLGNYRRRFDMRRAPGVTELQNYGIAQLRNSVIP